MRRACAVRGVVHDSYHACVAVLYVRSTGPRRRRFFASHVVSGGSPRMCTCTRYSSVFPAVHVHVHVNLSVMRKLCKTRNTFGFRVNRRKIRKRK